MSYFDSHVSNWNGYSGGVVPVSHDPHSYLGQEVLMDDSGALSPVSHSIASSHVSSPVIAASSAPTPTLVSVSGSNLGLELIWDRSVASAPSGFEAAVIAAAKAYVSEMTTTAKTILDIAVGWGEINGSAMSANALGESESYGYLTNYQTVAAKLSSHGDTFTATNEPTSAQFFLTSSQAKALGLVSGTSGSASSVDGYVGFSTLAGTGSSWNFGSTGTTSSQFNFGAVVSHEISEVMGRVGMEGTTIYNGHATYTPLDLFNFSANKALELSGNGGYFSNNNGLTALGRFNDSVQYGGDIADWASASSVTQSGTVSTGKEDAYNAFDWPGYNGAVSASDLKEMAALGYNLTAAGSAIV